MADSICHSCNSHTALVYDHTCGHIMCSECGLLLHSRPESPQARALRRMDEMGENLGLAEAVKERAKEVYKKAEEEKVWGRQRNPRAVMAACLYAACQEEEGNARTLKEIYGVGEGARMREIHKCTEILKKRKVRERGGIVHAKDIAQRYCTKLGLSHRTVTAVQEVVQKSEDYDIRRNSTSILAAAIFMVTQLSEKRMTLKEVAQASEVAEGTVKKAYKDLYTHASVLIPAWFANADHINKLSLP